MTGCWEVYPIFITAAVVAVVMLIPSVVSIALLHYLEKYNVRYNKISNIEIRKNRGRDIVCAGLGSLSVWGFDDFPRYFCSAFCKAVAL